MKSTLRFIFLFCVLGRAAASSATAQVPRQLTTTLLPVEERAAKGGPDGLLLLSQNKENTFDPNKDVLLAFDLTALPPGATIRNATLRLVARRLDYEIPGIPNKALDQILLSVQTAKHDFTGVDSLPSIVALSVTRTDTIASGTNSLFSREVYHKYTREKKISLRVFSNVDDASALFYSKSSFGASQSNIPRLVIEYTLPAEAMLEGLSWSQHQGNPEHTGRSSWLPYQNPNGYSLVKIDMPRFSRPDTTEQAGSIADYPLIYKGNIYLVYTVLGTNYLMAFDFKGDEVWRRDVGKGTVQRAPVISRNGRFYVVRDNTIAAYDLERSGTEVASFTLPGTARISNFTDLTVGNDGSLFLALRENDVNSIYGFTPELKPFLKSEPFASGLQNISTITVSADGRQIFAEVPDGAVIIDVVNPSKAQKFTLADRSPAKPLEYYHTPLAGPDSGVMIFSDFTSKENRGNVRGTGLGKRGRENIWHAGGTLIPQPVLGSDRMVYYIQNGALRRQPYNLIVTDAFRVGDSLNATSNLVLDGANNIYFWDNGELRGYSAKGELLFQSTFTDLQKRPPDPEVVKGEKATRETVSAGPEQFIRLMMGPDGTLWANNRSGRSLFAFVPSYATADLVVKEVRAQTVYRSTGALTVDTNVALKSGTQVLLQGKKSVSFSAGFRVEEGASLLVRTGF